ncbi:hypothetical protein DVR12_26420 [Chitinophaga silvatica]|uniref:DUF3887 domain-containing protein n=1 Tax=Chitinophaga silvatica TaxID=2282649 RepID=A0A3E1Y344_9BACT|nr:hypothetical protein [Chitinophaga silvatica]RFS18917.1 hypothetical protein DVR12_26420 [Chitinophaga silvatica]
MKTLHILILLGIANVISLNSMAQTSNENVVRAFLNTIFTTQEVDEIVVANKYFCFDPLNENLNEVKKLERHKIFSAFLKETKNKYQDLYNDTIPIIPYSQLPSSYKVPFDKNIQNEIVAVKFRNEKIMYIWLKNSKIMACDLYIQKDADSAYFITF